MINVDKEQFYIIMIVKSKLSLLLQTKKED
jgi:hypothetical protein